MGTVRNGLHGISRRLRYQRWRRHMGLPLLRRSRRLIPVSRGHARYGWRVPGCRDCCVRRALVYLTEGLEEAAADQAITAILAAPLQAADPPGSPSPRRHLAQTLQPATAGEPR
jgi:hypothetical protein